MNIIYIPGGPEASTAEGRPSQADMGEYIRRGTEINMAGHKIVNCALGNDDDDAVTFRKLSAYYRKGTALNMNFNKKTDLAPGTNDSDAVTLRQARSWVIPRTKQGLVRRNRFGTTVLLKCNHVLPFALYIRSDPGLLVQQPISIFEYSRTEEHLTPTLVLFITRKAALEGKPYLFQYMVNEDDLIEREPTEEERTALNPYRRGATDG